MNQLKEFLKNKKQPRLKPHCSCDEDDWCQDCLAKWTEVSQEMPDGTVSKGYFHTNRPDLLAKE